MNINEIARMAGVSRATVSRYLNDGYVSEEKRAAIRKVVERTGYVPSSQAQTLRTGKTKLVGVILPKINSESVGRMMAGHLRGLRRTPATSSSSATPTTTRRPRSSTSRSSPRTTSTASSSSGRSSRPSTSR
ncbi:MAG: LacI family transcriptional regulator [Atopobiaceae bacterium]|nr:LacI family transcriptional regulator [Atopobiaceae bacterium]